MVEWFGKRTLVHWSAFNPHKVLSLCCTHAQADLQRDSCIANVLCEQQAPFSFAFLWGVLHPVRKGTNALLLCPSSLCPSWHQICKQYIIPFPPDSAATLHSSTAKTRIEKHRALMACNYFQKELHKAGFFHQPRQPSSVHKSLWWGYNHFLPMGVIFLTARTWWSFSSVPRRGLVQGTLTCRPPLYIANRLGLKSRRFICETNTQSATWDAWGFSLTVPLHFSVWSNLL